MQGHEVNRKIAAFCGEVADRIREERQADICKDSYLKRFHVLASEVYRPDEVHAFGFYPNLGLGKVTYGQLFLKARQLKAIAGSRKFMEQEPEEAQAESGPLMAFMTTFCSAAIVFLVAAHFTATAGPMIRRLFGG